MGTLVWSLIVVVEVVWLVGFLVWFLSGPDQDEAEPIEHAPIEEDPDVAFCAGTEWDAGMISLHQRRQALPPAYLSPDEWFEDQARRGEGL